MQVDYPTLSKFRGILRDKNAKWCPDPATRLSTQIQAHFMERLFERFPDNKDQACVLIDTMRWIQQNYAKLQFENTWDRRMQHRVHCSNGATSVIILFNGCVTLRTCWLYEPSNKDQ